MKKALLVAFSLSAVSGVAHADVSLYGVLDLGVVQMTNAGDISPTFVTGAVPTGAQPNTAKFGTVRGMMNGGESQSRWGIKGSEDLGNGNKAFFQLESAFSLGNGTLATSGLAGGAGTPSMVADTALNGQLFNRMAFIGLSNNDLGAVTFGRQYSLQLDIIGSVGGGYDPVNAQMFSPINFSGSYGGGGATDNSRVDNAIKYAKKFGNFNVNALYGFGGMAGNNAARSNAQLNLGYEADRFGVQAAVQNAKDTTLIAPPGGNANGSAVAATPYNSTGMVNATFTNLTSYMLAGRYQVTDPLTLKAGYERMQLNAPGDPTGDLALTQIYQYNIWGSSAFTGQKVLNVTWLGANYQISPAMKASVGYYNVAIPGYIGTGGTPLDSTDKYTSAMLEYNLSKNTNLYAAFMLDKKSGPAAIPANLPTNYNTYGAGVRVKF